MIFLVLGCLIAGVLCGRLLPGMDEGTLSQGAQYVLYLLMFSVGISVGGNKQVFRRIREYHFRILVIPLGIIAASLASAPICALLTGLPLRDSAAIVSGLGWYSLSGVMIAEYAGAEMGTLAFLANLARELLSFLLIPFLARHCNAYTAIAPAAATSEDTTLSFLIRYTSEEIVIMAVFNGVLCSAVVPVLIRLCYGL